MTGVVTDKSTGQPLDGATITSNENHSDSAISAASPDPAVPDGFYWLFSPVGSHSFTAADNGYTPATSSVTVTPDHVTQQNWALNPVGGS